MRPVRAAGQLLAQAGVVGLCRSVAQTPERQPPRPPLHFSFCGRERILFTEGDVKTVKASEDTGSGGDWSLGRLPRTVCSPLPPPRAPSSVGVGFFLHPFLQCGGSLRGSRPVSIHHFLLPPEKFHDPHLNCWLQCLPDIPCPHPPPPPPQPRPACPSRPCSWVEAMWPDLANEPWEQQSVTSRTEVRCPPGLSPRAMAPWVSRIEMVAHKMQGTWS